MPYFSMASSLLVPGWHGCSSAAPVQVEQPAMLAPRCGFSWPPESMMMLKLSEPPLFSSFSFLDAYANYGSDLLSKRIILHFNPNPLLDTRLMWPGIFPVALSPISDTRHIVAADWGLTTTSTKWLIYFSTILVKFCEGTVQNHVLCYSVYYFTYGFVCTVSEDIWVSQPYIISKAIIQLPSGPEPLSCFFRSSYNAIMVTSCILCLAPLVVSTLTPTINSKDENN